MNNPVIEAEEHRSLVQEMHDKLSIAMRAMEEIEDSTGCSLGHYGTQCCIEESGIYSLAKDALFEIKNFPFGYVQVPTGTEVKEK